MAEKDQDKSTVSQEEEQGIPERGHRPHGGRKRLGRVGRVVVGVLTGIAAAIFLLYFYLWLTA